MPCIDSSGKPTESGRRILAALTNPTTLEDAARQAGLPLYLVRSGVREITRAGLIEEKNGLYVLTAAGRALLGI
jgi:predicted transcriptional regulator